MRTHAERISAHIVLPVSVLYWKPWFKRLYLLSFIAMMLKLLTLLIIGCAYAAPAENDAESAKTAAIETQKDRATNDLNTDASSYYDRYSDYSSRGYPSTYGTGGYGSSGVTGYGSGGYGGGGIAGYGTGGYGSSGGYAGAGGYGSGGVTGYGSGGVTGYGSIDDRYSYESNGYDRGYPASYGGYSGSAGYEGNRGGFGGNSGGYGGYGGNGGNGGLNSYYGYNNPSYQGYGHTGYGYYNRRPGYGNIYNGGITPSLVTGYRGYSRK